MRTECKQVSLSQLQALLIDQEDSCESTEISQHVETCDLCQHRLLELLNQDGIEREASQLLSGYWVGDDSEAGRTEANTLRSSRLETAQDSEFDKVLLGAPSHPEMLGRIGRYEIERRVGSGGMGVVFKAIDTELNRTVAIKVLAPHLARNGAARQRFSRESRAAAAVVHEHVVAIHNVDSSGEYPYLVMQYVSGESLQSRVEREGPLSVERILRVGIQAALGLAAAHEQGIVHRDIKPANMLLEDGVDRLLITDFGLARTVDDASLTHTGVVAGTPSYMSPEQATGDEVDHRTDLFSLGSVLYYTATGHPPFRAERAMGVLHRICHSRHRPVWQVNASLPDELSDLIDRLLEKRPGKRFASAAVVAESLTRLLQRLQHRRPGMFARLNSWSRRHSRAAMLSVATLMLAFGLSAWGMWRFKPSMTAMRTGPFIPSPLGQSSARVEDEMVMDSSSGIDRQMGMATANSLQPSPAMSGSSVSTDGESTSVFLYQVSGREAFDQSLGEITFYMDMLEQVAPDHELDSTTAFRRELQMIEQDLKKIDPTVAPKKK